MGRVTLWTSICHHVARATENVLYLLYHTCSHLSIALGFDDYIKVLVLTNPTYF